MYLQLGIAGLRSLENYEPVTKVRFHHWTIIRIVNIHQQWGQAHSQV